MGILESAKPAIVICTRDRARAIAFYSERLGLVLAHEDKFAAVFNTGGVTLRVSFVADFTPHEHTILGFTVTDVTRSSEEVLEKRMERRGDVVEPNSPRQPAMGGTDECGKVHRDALVRCGYYSGSRMS